MSCQVFDAGVVALSGLMATKRTATRRNVEGAHEQQNKEQKRKTPKKHWRKAKLIGSEQQAPAAGQRLDGCANTE